MQDETYPVEPAALPIEIGILASWESWHGYNPGGFVLSPWQIKTMNASFAKIGIAAEEAVEFYRSLGIGPTIVTPSDRPKDKNGRPIPPPSLHNAGPRPNRAFSHRGRKLI